MRVGVPTEVKDHEYRVAITPAGVHELSRHGHDVLVQAGAGTGSSTNSQRLARRSFPAARTSGQTRN
jgi:alanine dehydrogenase